jgi:hypothetical protein
MRYVTKKFTWLHECTMYELKRSIRCLIIILANKIYQSKNPVEVTWIWK